jgi:hypothetical protein
LKFDGRFLERDEALRRLLTVSGADPYVHGMRHIIPVPELKKESVWGWGQAPTMPPEAGAPQFGPGMILRSPFELFQIGPKGNLIDSPADNADRNTTSPWESRWIPWKVEMVGHSALRGTLLRPELLADVHLAGPALPAYLAGKLTGGDPQRPVELAIGVNGRIWATTQTYQIPGLESYWTAMVPKEALREGRNGVRVFEIDAPTIDRVLLREIHATPP